ncbi:MAG: CmpA/NrtA family ABC transporter substrate-binding protein [Pirellulales bacterium]
MKTARTSLVLFGLLSLTGMLLVAASGCGSATAGSKPADVASNLGDEKLVELLPVEKDRLRLGFIKLTDCAPLVIAKEKGFFDDEGLEVAVESQANWKVLLDRVVGGELDGAHMLAGQPIGATIGFGTQAHIITACSLDLNGNAITVSNRVWEKIQAADERLRSPTPTHPISAAALRPVIDEYRAAGKDFNFGMVFPVSTHNYELRYWLAAAGIHPGYYTSGDARGVEQAEAVLSVTPPPQMPAVLEAGTIDAYCVGEPWNQQAVRKRIGIPVVTDSEIWRNNPEKVFGVTAEWNAKYPQTHLALVKSIIRACQWLDATDVQGKFTNREEACRILSRPEYVGADYEVLAASMTGTFTFQPSDQRAVPEFNVFFKNNATYPYYSDCVWLLTQMRRWGQVAEKKSDAWYHETAAKVYRPDIYRRAADSLVRSGHLPTGDVPRTDGYKPATAEFIDGVSYDGRRPTAYLESLKIGLK